MAKYTIIEEIGRGGFGLVELIRDKKGREFAGKTLVVPPTMSKKDMQARFEREVKYQSAISHRNVVPILDTALDEDPPWFVMPLACGSLADDLRNDRTLGGDPKSAIFDVLSGIEELHRKGYKHRDLSPNNVLKFEDEDGEEFYAVSDFGLMAPEVGTTTTLTDTNAAGGTLLYRAPECAVDFKRATAAADIYSVGAILHDIFGGGSSRVPHTELRAPGEIGEIIAKCTKTNPRRRYKSISELREALYDFFESGPIDFQSDAERDIVGLLRDNDTLTNDQWDEVFAFIDRTQANGGSLKNVLSAVRSDHVTGLLGEAPELFQALGSEYSAFAAEHSFDFDFCDVIAAIAQIFYDHGELSLQAEIALSMLELGATHNRWYVERKFLAMAGPGISLELAERIKVEAEVKEFPFNRRFQHVMSSISVTDSSLHPALASLVSA